MKYAAGLMVRVGHDDDDDGSWLRVWRSMILVSDSESVS